MSNKSSQNSKSDPNQDRTSHNSLLAQFTNATAAGYHPQPQATTTYSMTTGFNANSTSSANQTVKNAANTFLPLPAQPIDLTTFQGLKFVTLDGLLIETRDIYDQISGTFKWEMCEGQEDRCVNYIRDQCANKRTFFMTSGGLGKNVVPKIHDLPQLYAIYIYCADVVTSSANQTVKNAANTFLPLPAQPIDLTTFKGLKFVALDGLLIETRDIYDQISGTIQWEMCESQEDRCMSYIRDQCANRRTFLMTSGGLGKNVVPKIHDLPQLYAIYIYCADVVHHQEWACKYSKVRVVCNNDDLYLLPQLAVDVAQANIDWGDALLKSGKRDEAKKKFSKADENLTKYAKNPDPTMVNEVKKKLDECK
ncbi:unnamed protein product [Rotaria sp. Silwood1]|nr:unnamed protein product [Rotaria sp. Silwood1]